MSLQTLEKIPFYRPIGIELTFVPSKIIKYHTLDYFDIASNFLKKYTYEIAIAEELGVTWHDYLKAYKSFYNNSYDIHLDDGCIEHPSPVFTNIKQLSKWWHKAVDNANSVGLDTYHPAIAGGAGHIHMSGLSVDDVTTIAANTYLFPYLTWIFAEPQQSEWCGSLCNVFGYNGNLLRYDEVFNSSSYSVTPNYSTAYRIILENKLSILRIKEFNNEKKFFTLEWRAADAPYDWKEQVAMVAFYQSYVNWCLTKSPIRKFKDITEKQITELKFFKKDKTLCIDSFKDLLKKLNLQYSDYKTYVDYNLTPAFEWKTLRL